MRLIGAVRRETGLEVPLRAVFEQPTPQGLGRVLATSANGEQHYNPLLALRTTGSQPPLFCVHPAGGIATVYQTLAEHLNNDIPVYGLQARGVEFAEPAHVSVKDMACCYIEAIRKVQPQGPYWLLGWSFGGNVALEITHLLESEGDNVEILILLDTSVTHEGKVFAEIQEDQRLLNAAKDLGINIDGVPTDQAKQYVLDAMLNQGLLPAGADVPFLERIATTMQRSVNMMHSHKASPIKAPIFYLRASDNKSDRLEETISVMTSGPVIIENTSEIHGKMCSEESSSALARQINGYAWKIPIKAGS
jgi:thioesterase domain-containing protein